MKIVQDILDNKNDLIEGTFCYLLFEDHIFDEQLLADLIGKIEYAATHGLLTRQVYDTVRWIVDCTDVALRSHNDKDDLYTITNYTPATELNWNSVWRKQIACVIKES